MKNLTGKLVFLLLVGALISANTAAQVSQTSSGVPAVAAQAAQAPAELSAESIASLRSYIHDAWQTLTRSMTDCRSLADPKLKQQPVLYVPADSQIPAQVQQLESTRNIR